MSQTDKPSLREKAITAIGGYAGPLRWYRAKRPRWLWKMVSPFGRPTTRYVQENGLVIKRGDFAGLVFPEASLGHTNYLAAKLAGTYEPTVIDFLSRQAPEHEIFVDFGAGDGFFCAGIARQVESLRLIGYELNRYERDLSQQIARANGVEFEMRERAGIETFADLPAGRMLLLCDLEGLEEDLLDPEKAPRLKETTIAVESHEMFRPGVTETLTRRFEPTHEVIRSESVSTDPGSVPELNGWDRASAELAVYDGHRDGEGWLFMVPRGRSTQGS